MEEKNLTEQIKYTGKNEGYSNTPYLDTVQKLTVGYGYNISARGIPSDWIPYIKDQLKYIKFPDELMENVFKSDLLYFWAKLSDSFDWFDDLSNERKMVLIDMCYNVGWNSFNQFKKMISALSEKNYDKAAKEILDSEYARTFAKLGSKRAITNSNIMLNNDTSKVFFNLN
ncbi:MAG: hypothetical protein E6R13_03885 [Spirochaetes bacterium]|nr:MAG: hypothetical protein E6R13_03885 [Spirochaetota bacterium]